MGIPTEYRQTLALTVLLSAAAASESSEQGQDHWEAAQGEYDAEDDGWDQVEVDDALRLA